MKMNNYKIKRIKKNGKTLTEIIIGKLKILTDRINRKSYDKINYLIKKNRIRKRHITKAIIKGKG